MSFTFEQSKDFKRWGYDAEKYGVEEYNFYNRDLPNQLLFLREIDGVSQFDSEQHLPIPTGFGVMEWLKTLIKKSIKEHYVELWCRHDGTWLARIPEYHSKRGGMFFYVGTGPTPHDAIFELAKKVKGDE